MYWIIVFHPYIQNESIHSKTSIITTVSPKQISHTSLLACSPQSFRPRTQTELAEFSQPAKDMPTKTSQNTQYHPEQVIKATFHWHFPACCVLPTCCISCYTLWNLPHFSCVFFFKEYVLRCVNRRVWVVEGFFQADNDVEIVEVNSKGKSWLQEKLSLLQCCAFTCRHRIFLSVPLKVIHGLKMALQRLLGLWRFITTFVNSRKWEISRQLCCVSKVALRQVHSLCGHLGNASGQLFSRQVMQLPST